jgi:hypothetical protein
MQASELVVKKATQPIIVESNTGIHGHITSNNHLYMLYHARLPWKDSSLGDSYLTSPIVVGFRVDEHMVGESYLNESKPFMTWAHERAREIMDKKVLHSSWQVALEQSHLDDSFHVRLIAEEKEELSQKVFGQTMFHWTYFFEPGGLDYKFIDSCYHQAI